MDQKVSEFKLQEWAKIIAAANASNMKRKDWLAASGADASATMYSIVETAKANNIKVYDYIKLLLEEIPKHMDDKDTDFLDELMPWSETVKAKCQKRIKTK